MLSKELNFTFFQAYARSFPRFLLLCYSPPWTKQSFEYFMGLSSTLIYTSELILCSIICVPSATRHNIQSFENLRIVDHPEF